MNDVTALIITKNEELNIAECINSIKPLVHRILIIDSGSSDRTVEIAKRLGADVYFHEFETHAKQRNWALDNCNIKTKWVLRIDADERLTPKLIEEFAIAMEKHSDDDVNGFVVSAYLYFMGRKIVFGGSRKKKLILFKYGFARIEEREMDEHTILLSGKSITLKEKFLHYDFKNLTTYIEKLNWYSDKEVRDYFNGLEGNDTFSGGDKEIIKTRKNKSFYYKLPKFFRCKLFFFYRYILQGNFLNGREGRLYSYLYHYYYRWLIDSKIFEKEKALKNTKNAK